MVGGDNLSQVPRTGRVLVTQLGGRQGPRRLRHRPTPVGQRHRAEIGDAVLEVDLGRSGRRGRGRGDAERSPGRPGLRQSGRPGPGADRGLDVSLGQQLLVGIDDRAAGHAEQRGQSSSRRQALAGAQPSIADRRPQLVLELNPERTSVTVQRHQKVGATAGPVHRHATSTPNGPLQESKSGPSYWTASAPGLTP